MIHSSSESTLNWLSWITTLLSFRAALQQNLNRLHSCFHDWSCFYHCEAVWQTTSVQTTSQPSKHQRWQRQKKLQEKTALGLWKQRHFQLFEDLLWVSRRSSSCEQRLDSSRADGEDLRPAGNSSRLTLPGSAGNIVTGPASSLECRV